MQKVERLQILGMGCYKPKKIMKSSILDQQFGLAPGSICKYTGVIQRYYVKDETASEMAFHASLAALSDAKCLPNDIDCIISACGTMEQAIPCNAALVHAKLNPEKPIPAFDINMTCLSTITALDVAASLIAQNKYNIILIVASDIASIGINWSDIKTAGIFGDGAAAILVTSGKPSQGILARHFSTYSEGIEYCRIRGGGTRYHPRLTLHNFQEYCLFEMSGKKIYRLAANVLTQFTSELLTKANLTMNDIDWVVPHQASASALKHIQQRLAVPNEKFINIFADHGNQVAASLPTALYHLRTSKALKSGHKIMLLGTGAGLSVGGLILEY